MGIARPISILTQKDVEHDEHICPDHGEMERYDLHIKYEDKIWHPKQSHTFFVCTECLNFVREDLEERLDQDLDLKDAVNYMVLDDWERTKQDFEFCTHKCPYNLEAQEGLLR